MKASPRFLIRVAILVLFVGTLPVFGAEDRAGKRTDDNSLFSAEEYLGHVAYLASNELEGRGTGQEGNDKAADYIAGVFRKLGVQPAGDDESYFQNFSLKLKNRIGDGTSLCVGTKGRLNRRRLSLHADYVPFPFSETKSFAGDVVFAGYGIVNTELGYDDYAGLDVADKVVLILRGSPRFAEFNRDEDMSFRSKASKANARDAVAILVVNSLSHSGEADDEAAQGDQSGDRLYDFDEASPGMFGFGRQNYGIPMLHLTRPAAERMLKAAGMAGFEALERRIEDTRKPASKPLKGVSVKGAVAIEPVETPVRNVVGMIPGTGANADEIIVLGAHYDHTGVVNKGQPNYDPERDIHNGADDNASGTSMLMTMATAFTRGPPPNRSILLIAFTGEELGLLGSQHFVNYPTVALDKCIAMLNFDMVGRLKDDHLEIGGMRTGGFEDLVQRLAETYGLSIKDGGGGSGPSDHEGFYSKKVPVMFFFTGLHRQYHQPTDDAGLINSEGAMRIAKLATDCIDEIDSRPERPAFKTDDRDFTLDVQEDEGGKGPWWVGAHHDSRAERRGRGRLGLRLKHGDDTGAVVERVIKDSPADRAGIKEEDRIIKIGESPVKTARDLFSSIRKLKRGDMVKVVVERSGGNITVEFQLGEPGRPPEPEQLFGEIGKSLMLLAEQLKEEASTSSTIRAVSWTTSPDSLIVLLRSTDRDEAWDFIGQTARIIKQLPQDDSVAVNYAIKIDLGETEEDRVTEVSITLKKREPASDSGKKKSSPADAAKGQDDDGEKAKVPDKAKPDRKLRPSKRKAAA